jgi:Cu/Ag efflux pump CusA
VTPALSHLLLGKPQSRSAPVVRQLEKAHDRFIPRLIKSPRAAYGAMAVLILGGAALLPSLGRPDSLVPNLKDNNVLIHWEGALATSITEMSRITNRASAELKALPGVRDVGAHVGRAVLADQIVGSNSGEMWVNIDPAASYGKTLAAIKKVVAGYPGLAKSVVTYPQDRIAEVLQSSDHDLTVRVFGSDNDVLKTKAADVQQALSGVKGVVNPTIEGQTTEPTLEVEVNLDAAKKVGIKPGDVRRAASTLVSGLTVGALFEDQKVFDVVVWGTPDTRRNLSTVQDLLIDTPTGGHVRLGDVASVQVTSGQNIISHESVSRTLDVTANVSGRSVSDVAKEIKATLRQLDMPFEYHAEVVGDYVDRQEAQQQFIALAVAAAIGMLLVLQAAVGSWRLATIALVLLPASLTGCVIGVLLTGGDMTIGPLVGFFAVLGIAARHSVLLIGRYQQLERQGPTAPKSDLITRATRERFVPTVLTIVGAAVALAPMLLFTNVAGHEIAHPLSVVTITGLISAAIVTLVVLPALYVRFSVGQEQGLATPETIDLTGRFASTGADHNGDSEVPAATTATD